MELKGLYEDVDKQFTNEENRSKYVEFKIQELETILIQKDVNSFKIIKKHLNL